MILPNLSALAGASCLIYAAWLVTPSLAFFTAGVYFTAVAVGGVILHNKTKTTDKK